MGNDVRTARRNPVGAVTGVGARVEATITALHSKFTATRIGAHGVIRRVEADSHVFVNMTEIVGNKLVTTSALIDIDPNEASGDRIRFHQVAR